jgi:hypothetical protein
MIQPAPALTTLQSSTTIADDTAWSPSLAFIRNITVFTFVGSLAALLAMLVLMPEQRMRVLGPLIQAAVTAVAWWRIRQGDGQGALRRLAYGSWLTVTITSTWAGGLQAPFIMAYPVIIIIMGWLLTRREAIVFGVLSVVAILAMAAAATAGVIPTGKVTAPFYAGVVQICVVALSAVLIARLASAYHQRLADLQLAGREL